MPTPLAFNKLTITRIQVRLRGDEEEGDQAKGEPMDTETEAAGQASTQKAEARGAELHRHQLYLQMHSRLS